MCISVIIPVLNEAATLPTLLDSVRRLATEIIFVDGGSSDTTLDLLASSGFRWYSTPRGRATQMNAGAAAASGNVLMFVHADSKLPLDALHRVRAAVRDGAVGGNFAVRLDSRHLMLRLVGALITLRSRITGVATGDQVLFVTRDMFERMGGFAPLALFEDIEFSRRLSRAGPVARLPVAVVTSPRRWVSGGVVRTILRMWLLKTAYYAGVDPAWLAQHYEAAR